MLIGVANVEALLDKEMYLRAFKTVSEKRRSKALSLKGEADRRRCIASGILLNYMVWKYEQFGCRQINSKFNIIDLRDALEKYDKMYEYEVDTHKGGKPFFAKRTDIKYNLSHSGAYVVCAVADKEVGIDIEGKREFRDGIIKRFFSQYEKEWILDSQDTDTKMSRFLRLWTAKEAFAKVTGIGLARSIEKVHFKESECGILTICEEEFAKIYNLEEYALDEYRISVIFLK